MFFTKIFDLFKNKDQHLANLMTAQEETNTPVVQDEPMTPEPPQTPPISREQLRFQESSPGYRGMPYIEFEDGTTKFLDEHLNEIGYEPPESDNPISRLEIIDPRDENATDTEQQGVVIDDPEQLKTFNTIKSVADQVAPEYSDYLMRLAWYEGRGNPQNRLDNGELGVDRGIFQINNKAFPDVPDEFADDPARATMWAISAIEAGKQDRWVADKYVKNAKTNIGYANDAVEDDMINQ